jgi:hypothetical protein
MIVSAIAPVGMLASTVEIADALWSTAEAQIRREAAARGFSTWTPPPDSQYAQYAPERRCDDLASALEWISTLDALEWISTLNAREE